MASRFLVPYSSTRGWMQDPLFQLQREIDRVFEDVFSGGTGTANAGGRSGSTMMNAPRIDLQDSEGELRLQADLPGVQPADLDIRVEGDVLTIRGERKSESERNEQNFHVMERSHGRFQRSIQLPFAPDPDAVQASVREGVLEVRIPKRAPEERSRRIEVRGAESGAGRSMAAAVSGGSGAGSPSGVGASAGAGASTGQGAGGSASITPKGEADNGVRGGGMAESGAQSGGGGAGASGSPTTAPAGGSAPKR
jgi:HSP20 family protein